MKHETELVFVYGKVFKGGSRNCATFMMELFATIGNSRMLQRASSDGLTTNCFFKFAEQLSCQTYPDVRFYKKNCLLSTKRLHDYQYISINFGPTFTSSKLTKETIEQEVKYVQSWRKKDNRVTSTVCSCQLTSLWCLSLLILGIFHTIF